MLKCFPALIGVRSKSLPRRFRQPCLNSSGCIHSVSFLLVEEDECIDLAECPGSDKVAVGVTRPSRLAPVGVPVHIYISTCIGDLFCSAYPYPSIRQSPAPQKTLVAAQQACGILALMIVMMLTIALVGKAQAAEVPTTVHMTSANAF